MWQLMKLERMEAHYGICWFTILTSSLTPDTTTERQSDTEGEVSLGTICVATHCFETP
jgi:hypothetical protein